MIVWTITLAIIGGGVFAVFCLNRGSAWKHSRITFWLLISFIAIAVALVSTTIIVLNFQWRAPPEPEITYGEFPFRLEYEIDGEHFVIEDVLIAEFRGSFRGNPTTRPWRSWSRTLLYSNVNDLNGGRFLLHETDGVSIYFNPGDARYFMGYLGHIENEPVPGTAPGIMPYIRVRYPHNRPFIPAVRIEDAHELLAEHGITLISWEYTPPIVNRFG